jgi:hypothetical protein
VQSSYALIANEVKQSRAAASLPFEIVIPRDPVFMMAAAANAQSSGD